MLLLKCFNYRSADNLFRTMPAIHVHSLGRLLYVCVCVWSVCVGRVLNETTHRVRFGKRVTSPPDHVALSSQAVPPDCPYAPSPEWVPIGTPLASIRFCIFQDIDDGVALRRTVSLRSSGGTTFTLIDWWLTLFLSQI